MLFTLPQIDLFVRGKTVFSNKEKQNKTKKNKAKHLFKISRVRNEKVYTRVVIWMLLALLRIDLFASAEAKKILIEKNKQNRTKQNIRKVFTRVLLMWRCYI